MFPIFVLKEGTELPEEGIYYVVARDGIFLHKDTGLVEAMVRVRGISFLEDLSPRATIKLPKLPPQIIVRSLLFFRGVFKKFHSEAVVMVHYDLKNQIYRLVCPSQSVNHGAVAWYDAKQRFEGHRLVGSIHSHNDFGAFHSSIDVSDESDFDGIHITIGRVDQPYFTISCSVVVNNNRFLCVPMEIITGIREVDWKPAPRIIHRRKKIHRPKRDSFDFGFIDLLLHPEKLLPYTYEYERVEVQDRFQFYDMVLPDEQDYRHVGFPTNWLDRVSKTEYSQEKEDLDLQPALEKGGDSS